MASSEDDPKTKRARTSRPKVKTGCTNCKQRRIKCDEKRPACTQCVRSKKDCGGYPPPPRSARSFEVVPIAPKPGLDLLSAAPAPVGAAVPAPALAPALAPTPSSGPIRVAAPVPVLPSQPLHPPLLAPPSALPASPEQIDTQQGWHQQRQQQRQAQLHLHPRRAQKLSFRRNGPTTQAWPGIACLPVPALTFLYQPSTSLHLTSQEEHYFRLFRFHTANELSGFFDNVFWSETVLVACHADDAIRHAVVALGALYKTLEKTIESPPPSPNDPTYDAGDTAYSHWEVALRHYSNACHALAITSAQDAATQRTRLMASVLLACFDSFVGDHKQAIVQIQTGLALLERLRAEHRHSKGSESVAEEPVEDELTQMLTRLAIQAKSYDMAFHFPRPYVIQLLPAASTDPSSPSFSSAPPVPRRKHPIPERFSDLREARLAWDALCERIFRFMEYMLQQAQGPPNLLPRYMTRYGQEFVSDNEAWARAFEPLLQSRANPDISSQEKAGIAVLKMFQIMGQVLYSMTFSDSEMTFDAFQPHFQAIVRLAAEVVGDEERRAAAARCPDPTQCTHYQTDDYGLRGQHGPAAAAGHGRNSLLGCRASHIKASFSADLGIVPPLYVVATKSRDRLLRRQAIHLLRSSARREGMWDSELMARVGMWVVEIEEDGEEEEFLQQSLRTRLGSESSGAAGTPPPNISPLDVPQVPDTPDVLDLYGSGRQWSPAAGSAADPQAGRLGDLPLGPGGNARWDARRASGLEPGRTPRSRATSGPWSPAEQSLPYYMYLQRPVPAEKRVLVKSCEFDLREHTATLKCGTRGLAAGTLDPKWRDTRITW